GRFLLVLLDAPAVGVQDAEVVHREGTAPAGRPAVPGRRLLVVHLHAVTPCVDEAHAGRRGGVPLLGRLSVPPDRLGVVLLRAAAVEGGLAALVPAGHLGGRDLDQQRRAALDVLDLVRRLPGAAPNDGRHVFAHPVDDVFGQGGPRHLALAILRLAL